MRSFDKVRTSWEGLARADPFVAICNEPGREDVRTDAEAFFALGRDEVERAFQRLDSLGIRPPADGRALDFGCGAGRLTQALALHFKSCVGVDASETMIELANAYNAIEDRCSYLVNGPDLTGFATGSFDFVYSSAVLQHMESRLALGYVGEFLRIVRPSGVVVFDLPDAFGGRPFAVLQALERLRANLALRTRLLVLLRRAWGKPAIMPPRMEMFTVPEQTVRRVVDGAGRDVVHVFAGDAPSRTFYGRLGRFVRKVNWGYRYKQYVVRRLQ